MPAAPAVSCALGSGRTHTSNNEYTGITRRSRTQWFYDLFRALPGDRACLTPSSADMFCLSPVGPTQLRELDTSVGVSGPHDFAVRNNRPRAVDRSQAHHPPCNPAARKTLPRPPHPHPASVTIAIRPSGGVGWRKFVEMICPTGEAKYFCKGDSTEKCPTGKSPEPLGVHVDKLSPARAARWTCPAKNGPHRCHGRSHFRAGPTRVSNRVGDCGPQSRDAFAGHRAGAAILHDSAGQS